MQGVELAAGSGAGGGGGADAALQQRRLSHYAASTSSTGPGQRPGPGAAVGAGAAPGQVLPHPHAQDGAEPQRKPAPAAPLDAHGHAAAAAAWDSQGMPLSMSASAQCGADGVPGTAAASGYESACCSAAMPLLAAAPVAPHTAAQASLASSVPTPAAADADDDDDFYANLDFDALDALMVQATQVPQALAAAAPQQQSHGAWRPPVASQWQPAARAHAPAPAPVPPGGGLAGSCSGQPQQLPPPQPYSGGGWRPPAAASAWAPPVAAAPKSAWVPPAATAPAWVPPARALPGPVAQQPQPQHHAGMQARLSDHSASLPGQCVAAAAQPHSTLCVQPPPGLQAPGQGPAALAPVQAEAGASADAVATRAAALVGGRERVHYSVLEVQHAARHTSLRLRSQYQVSHATQPLQ